MSRCLNPESSPENPFRGSKHLPGMTGGFWMSTWQFCWWPFWDGETVTLSKAKWPPTRGWKGHLVQQQYFPDPVSISQCAQTWFYSFTVIVAWCLLMTQWAIDLDVPYYMTRKWAIGLVRTSIPCAVDGRSPLDHTKPCTHMFQHLPILVQWV